MSKRKRMSHVLKDNPQVKGKLDSLSKEMANMLIEQFEVAKQNSQDGGKINIGLNDEMREVFEKKGKELGVMVKEMVKETNDKNQNKANNRNHIVKVSIR